MPLVSLPNEVRSHGLVGAIFRGCLSAAVFVILATVVMALVVTVVDISDTVCANIQAGVGLIGVFLGGLSAGRRSSSKGWFVGLIVGLVYAIVFFLTSDGASPPSSRFFALGCQMLTIAAAGLLGGILGVNL